MIKRAYLVGFSLLVSCSVSAEFIIKAPADSKIMEPLKVQRNQNLAPPNPDNYTVIREKSLTFEEVGEPQGMDFIPEVFSSRINLANVLPALLPTTIPLYIHDSIDINKEVYFFSENDESWRKAVERFAAIENLSVLVDWNRGIIQVIPNTSRYSDKKEDDSFIADEEGNRYVVRKVEDDYQAASSNGYLMLNDQVYRIKETGRE